MMQKLAAFGLALALSSAATAETICSTNSDNCAGTWKVHNTTAEPTCYVVFWAGGNDTKNFCLQPGESATEQVHSGDAYCFAQNFTPDANTCNRQYMTAWQ